MKKKPFYNLMTYFYPYKRKWYNPLRYILGEDVILATNDIHKASKYWDIDVKDVTFIHQKLIK